MTHPDLLTDKDLRTRLVEEPAKRWRNWWKAPPDASFVLCQVCDKRESLNGKRIFKDHCAVFPSKDLAETAAYETLNTPPPEGFTPGIYLGARPEP